MSSGEYGFDYATVKYNGAGRDNGLRDTTGRGMPGMFPLRLRLIGMVTCMLPVESARDRSDP